MHILCHVGPCSKELLEQISIFIDKDSKIKNISSFHKLDDTEVVKKYTKELNSSIEIENTKENHETIKRCRVLRSIDYEVALKHVCCMRINIKKMLRKEKFDIVLSESIDQFLEDILFQEASKINIPCYGLIQSFVNGYFRVTNYGEPIYLREPNKKEVNELISTISKSNYIPNFIRKDKRNLIKSYLKKYFMNYLRFIFYFSYRRFPGNKFIYHYWASDISSRKSLHLLPQINLGEKNWEEILKKNKIKSNLFIPLQFFPESTIDYWVNDLEMIEYEKMLILFIKKLIPHFRIMIKEHPGVLGYRNPSFYREIKKISKDIIFIPTNVAADRCINKSDLVFVWTGSIGFESALRGKPVITTCFPYYSFGNNFKKINLNTSINSIKEFMNSEFFINFKKHDQFLLAKNLLKITAPGRFLNLGNFNPKRSEDINNSKKVAGIIRKLYLKEVSLN